MKSSKKSKGFIELEHDEQTSKRAPNLVKPNLRNPIATYIFSLMVV